MDRESRVKELLQAALGLSAEARRELLNRGQAITHLTSYEKPMRRQIEPDLRKYAAAK